MSNIAVARIIVKFNMIAVELQTRTRRVKVIDSNQLDPNLLTKNIAAGTKTVNILETYRASSIDVI